MAKDIYWRETSHTFQSGKGGYFIRTELGKFMEKLREQGLNPVAIVIDPDDPWNTEVVVEDE